MSDDIQTLKADLAFMRGLMDDGGSALALSGAMLVVIGTVFGLVNVQYWLVYKEILEVPRAWVPWLWLDGVAVAVIAARFVSRRCATRPSAASRAMLAAWTAVGIGISVAGISLAIGGERLGVAHLVPAVFPVVLFVLYGAAWWVAYAVQRRAWIGLVAAACFTVAVGCALVMGRADEWLVMALGLFLLVAAPGIAITRSARRA